MRWFERHRTEWILETLQVFGYINREHLVRKFGISVQQASHDLSEFQRKYPGIMVYDKSVKRFLYIDDANEMGLREIAE